MPSSLILERRSVDVSPGPPMDEDLRRALIVSRGDPAMFLREPLSAVFLAATACAVLLIVTPRMRAMRARLRED